MGEPIQQLIDTKYERDAADKAAFVEYRAEEDIIPTAPNIDSLGDSQIRESLTRCWLLKEEQHRWVQRLRSDGLI